MVSIIQRTSMILNDNEILDLALDGMIKPFVAQSVRVALKHNGSPLVGASKALSHKHSGVEIKSTNVLSYGLSSFGYDVRLADDVKIFTNQNASIIDPKNLDENSLVDASIKSDSDGSSYVILPPNSYMLGHTVETFDVPRDVMIVCVGKSTYARAGCLCNVTPIEPGFNGQIVIELANSTTLPMKIYLNEGIAQFLFFRGNPCSTSYADKGGKYQGQTGITLPKV